MRMNDTNGFKMTVTPTKIVDLPILAAVSRRTILIIFDSRCVLNFI